MMGGGKKKGHKKQNKEETTSSSESDALQDMFMSLVKKKCARGMCEADPDRTRACLVVKRLSLCCSCVFHQGRQDIGG